MNTIGLLFRLAMLPFKRSWVVLGLMLISLAQMMLGVWFCGSLQDEISRTRLYATEARMVTIQLKDEKSDPAPIRDLLSGPDVSLEEWKTEETLAKLEQEEPELVQTIRSIGAEGMQLVPRLLVARGRVSDEALSKIKMMTDVARIESSPVHHARLLHFYQHLGLEIKIALAVLLVLIFVQLVVFQRIQARDMNEVVGNLIAWGVTSFKARFPAFLSMLSLSLIASFISVGEWIFFRKWIWRDNAFLGELSLDHSLPFPWAMVGLTFLSVMVMSVVLVFAGRVSEE